MELMKSHNKIKILDFLKERGDKPTTSREIGDELGMSYPTLAKWLAVLEAEGRILVKDYGNIKFYYFKKA